MVMNGVAESVVRVVVSSHVCGSKALSSIVVEPFGSMLTVRLRNELET